MLWHRLKKWICEQSEEKLTVCVLCPRSSAALQSAAGLRGHMGASQCDSRDALRSHRPLTLPAANSTVRH